MKPGTRIAMANIIEEARKKIPLHLSIAGDCVGRYDECAQKRLEFLITEINDWE